MRRACDYPTAAAILALTAVVLAAGCRQTPRAGGSGPSASNGGRASRDYTPVDFGAVEYLAPESVQPQGGEQPTTRPGVMSIINAPVQVELHPRDQQHYAAKILTLRAPFTVRGAARRILIDSQVRGAVIKDADARVVIVADLGGTQRVFEFPYGRPVDEPSFFANLRGRMGAGDGRALAYHGTVLVIVERRRPDATVLAHIDSIDVGAGAR